MIVMKIKLNAIITFLKNIILILIVNHIKNVMKLAKVVLKKEVKDKIIVLNALMVIHFWMNLCMERIVSKNANIIIILMNLMNQIIINVL